jgi:hypothetical protein
MAELMLQMKNFAPSGCWRTSPVFITGLILKMWGSSNTHCYSNNFQSTVSTIHYEIPAWIIMIFLCQVKTTTWLGCYHQWILTHEWFYNIFWLYVHSHNYKLTYFTHTQQHQQKHFYPCHPSPSSSLNHLLLFLYVLPIITVTVGIHHDALPITALVVILAVTCGFLLSSKSW